MLIFGRSLLGGGRYVARNLRERVLQDGEAGARSMRLLAEMSAPQARAGHPLEQSQHMPRDRGERGLEPTASDADGDPLSSVLVSDVSYGNLVLNGDGSFSYTPALNFNGADGFNHQKNIWRDAQAITCCQI